jgi:hypothetical protein
MAMLPEESVPSLIKKPKGGVTFWVLYERPSDFPQGWVLRPQFACPRYDGLERDAARIILDVNGFVSFVSKLAWYGKTAEELVAILPVSCVVVGRQPDDDPSIACVWIE